MDVADCGTVVTSVSSNAAGVLVGGVIRSVDVKVLDKAVGGNDTEEAEVVLLRGCIEVLDGVTLPIEVALVAGIGNSSCLSPVADRCPSYLSFLRVFSFFFRHQVCEVDVGGKHGIGIEGSLIHRIFEPYKLLCCCNLVETVGIGSQVVLVEFTAIGAEAVNEVMLVLYNSYILVGVGGAVIDVTVTVFSSGHIDLCMGRIECGLCVCAQSLVPADDGLVAVQCIADLASTQLVL